VARLHQQDTSAEASGTPTPAVHLSRSKWHAYTSSTLQPKQVARLHQQYTSAEASGPRYTSSTPQPKQVARLHQQYTSAEASGPPTPAVHLSRSKWHAYTSSTPQPKQVARLHQQYTSAEASGSAYSSSTPQPKQVARLHQQYTSAEASGPPYTSSTPQPKQVARLHQQYTSAEASGPPTPAVHLSRSKWPADTSRTPAEASGPRTPADTPQPKQVARLHQQDTSAEASGPPDTSRTPAAEASGTPTPAGHLSRSKWHAYTSIHLSRSKWPAYTSSTPQPKQVARLHQQYTSAEASGPPTPAVTPQPKQVARLHQQYTSAEASGTPTPAVHLSRSKWPVHQQYTSAEASGTPTPADTSAEASGPPTPAVHLSRSKWHADTSSTPSRSKWPAYTSRHLSRASGTPTPAVHLSRSKWHAYTSSTPQPKQVARLHQQYTSAEASGTPTPAVTPQPKQVARHSQQHTSARSKWHAYTSSRPQPKQVARLHQQYTSAEASGTPTPAVHLSRSKWPAYTSSTPQPKHLLSLIRVMQGTKQQCSLSKRHPVVENPAMTLLRLTLGHRAAALSAGVQRVLMRSSTSSHLCVQQVNKHRQSAHRMPTECLQNAPDFMLARTASSARACCLARPDQAYCVTHTAHPQSLEAQELESSAVTRRQHLPDRFCKPNITNLRDRPPAEVSYLAANVPFASKQVIAVGSFLKGCASAGGLCITVTTGPADRSDARTTLQGASWMERCYMEGLLLYAARSLPPTCYFKSLRSLELPVAESVRQVVLLILLQLRNHTLTQHCRPIKPKRTHRIAYLNIYETYLSLNRPKVS